MPECWPVVRHLMGKDIIRFHCVYWPAMLLSAGYDPPKQIFAHGYLLLDDLKISKSLGNAIDPLDLIDVYGADAVRYWCARAVSFGQDGSASIAGIADRYERELGNDLGNLLSRTTAMLVKYRGGALPQGRTTSDGIAAAIAQVRDGMPELVDSFDLTGAIDLAWTLVRELNRYVTEQAPWTLAKDDANAARLDQVLHDLVDGLRAAAVALWAYLPETTPRILAALGQPDRVDWDLVTAGRLEPADDLVAAQPLFPRIESVGVDAA
jgi:methionyl-tRNA synthetase